MSLIASPYLSDRSLKIRSKAIPWDGYQRAGLLSAEDVRLIQRVAGSREKAEPILDAEGEAYAALYVRLLSKLSRNDTLQFILVLVGEFIANREDRIPLFFDLQESPYPALLKLLNSPDSFVRLKSSVLASILLAVDSEPQDDVVGKLLGFLGGVVHSPNEPDAQDVAVQCLESVLRVSKARKAAWAAEVDDEAAAGKSKIVEGLLRILQSSSPSPQMQYQLGFCMWLLTFEKEVADGIQSRLSLIPNLLLLARRAQKEKILRIVLSTFRNLLTLSPAANLPALLAADAGKWLKSLEGRAWADEEAKEDWEWVRGEVKAGEEGMSTFAIYLSTLTNPLSWTPPHKSEDFWQINAPKLLEKDKTALKRLVDILKTSDDSTSLAVAANDLAMFLKWCDGGKKALDSLSVKARAMELMTTHPDPEVKYQNLIVTQRLIGGAWA
ncbi:hypothetical protein JCM11641_005358 [Rhodosporidiobolus odoratus]